MQRALILLLAVSGPVLARAPDGTLWLIQTPNNGMPAIVLPGGEFDAVLTEQATLTLVGEGPAIQPETTWTPLTGGRSGARCRVPTGTAPGVYALEANAPGERVDRNVRAVYVRESFPETYKFAHITDTHIGNEEHARSSDTILRDVLQTVTAAGAAFVLVTGDLTHGGNPDEFRRFIEALDTCPAPTFVSPGNHDRQALNYEKTFGPLTYMFWFGQDGYLGFDTKDFITADDGGEQDACLERYRRILKPARWTIGFTHRYEPAMGMRSQLILFVDDPLDLLVFGHRHRNEETVVPWGTTPMIVTSAGMNGSVRLIEVTPAGIVPQPPIRAARIR